MKTVKPPMSFGKRKRNKIDKKVASVFLLLHLLCIFAPFQINWGAFSICLVLFTITSLFGITISYHRNLSHKSFQIPKWLEYLFAYCGVHALQVQHSFEPKLYIRIYMHMLSYVFFLTYKLCFRVIQLIG